GELAGADAARAGADPAGHASDERPDLFEVQVPLAVRHVVRVADPAPRHGGLSTEFAMLGHYSPVARSADKKRRILHSAGLRRQEPPSRRARISRLSYRSAS